MAMLVIWCGLALALFGGWNIFVYLDSKTSPERLKNLDAGFTMFIGGNVLFVAGRLARSGMNKAARGGTKE